MAKEFEIIGTVDNPEWRRLYGTMQKVYKAEKGMDPHTAAKNLLKGMERTGTVEAIGDPSCITGYAVGIRDEHTGLVGIFQIESDEHTWENGVHAMKLGLRFDTMMEEAEYQEKRRKGRNMNGIMRLSYKSGSKEAGMIKLRDYLTEEGYTDLSYDGMDTFAVKDYVRYWIDIPESAGVEWIGEERYVRDVSRFTYTKVAPEEGSIAVRNYLGTVYGIADEAIGYDGANATIYNTPVVIAGLREIGGRAYAFPEAVDEVSAAILSLYWQYRYEHDLDLLPGEAYLSKYVEREGGAVGFDATYTHYVIMVGQVSKAYPVSQFTIVNEHAVIRESDWEDTMAYDFKGKDENGYRVGDKSGRKVVKVYPGWSLVSIAEGLTGDQGAYTVLQKANMQLLNDGNHGSGDILLAGDELDVTGLLDIWEKRAVNRNGYAVRTVNGKKLITACSGWHYEQIAQDLTGNRDNWVKIKDLNGNSVYSCDVNHPYIKVIAAGDILDVSDLVPGTGGGVLDRLRNNTSLGLTQSQKQAIISIASTLLDKDYEPAFVAGILGNVLFEGTSGYFESSAYISNPSAKPAYLQYMDEYYNYREEFSGQNISVVGIKKTYDLLKVLEQDNYIGKFGLGAVQWTGGRTMDLIMCYIAECGLVLDENGNLTTEYYPTAEQCRLAENKMIVKELESACSRVYEYWLSQYSSNRDSALAANGAGRIACQRYEIPAVDTSVDRGNKAEEIYNVMMGFN